MHVFRLLKMAREIVLENRINVRRKDRETLLQIKAGTNEYDELARKADEMMLDLKALYQNSPLPDAPDPDIINPLLVHMRSSCYQQQY